MLMIQTWNHVTIVTSTMLSEKKNNTTSGNKSPTVTIQKIPFGRRPKISVAMYSVLSLVILYFLVLTFEMFNKNIIFSPCARCIYGKRDQEELRREKEINDALLAQINQIPMFCMYKFVTPTFKTESFANTSLFHTLRCTGILFLFSRLRAKVDLENTEPPPYAKQAYVIACIVIYFQVLVASVITKKPAIYVCVVIILILLKIISFINLATIFYSIFTLKKMQSEF